MAGFEVDIGLYNQGRAANPNFNFMMRVEGIFDLPCRRVHSFTKANEYEYIQEGGLNDYVHMRRKPISQPFTFQVERYVGVDILDPLQPGTDLILPIVLMVWRMQMNNNFTPYRIYTFTGCNVMSKEYGELNAEQSGLLVETTTIGYRELIRVTTPDFMFNANGTTNAFAEYSQSEVNDKLAHQQRNAKRSQYDHTRPEKRPGFNDGKFDFKDYEEKNKKKDKKPVYARQFSDPRGIDYTTGKPKTKRPKYSDGAEYAFKKYAEENKAKDKKPKYARQWSDPRGIDHATGKPKTKRTDFSDGAEFEFKKYAEANKGKDKKPVYAEQWSDPRGIDHATGKPNKKRPKYSDGAEFDFETNAGMDEQQPVYSKFNYQDPPTPVMWPGGDADPVRANKVRGDEAAEAAADTPAEGAEEGGEEAASVERKRDAHSTPGGDKKLAAMWPGDEADPVRANQGRGAVAGVTPDRSNFSDGEFTFGGTEPAFAESPINDAQRAEQVLWEGGDNVRANKLEGQQAAGDRSNFSDGEFQFSKTALEPTYAKSNDQDPPAPVMWTGGDNVRANKLEGESAGGSRSDFSDGEFAFGGKTPDFANTPANDAQRAEQVLWEGGANVRANKLEGGGSGGSRSDFSDGEFAFGGTSPDFANTPANDSQRAEKVLWEGGANVRANQLEGGAAGGSRSDFSDGEFTFGGKAPAFANASPNDAQRAQKVLWEGGKQNVRANKKKEGGGGGSRSSFSDGKFAFGGKSPSYAKSSSTDSQRAEQVLWEGWQQGPKGSTATKRAKMADLLK
ncbi:MAG: hypothetical protein K6B72_05640 [Lachnospiraceae bacterium]|nr:hypothetical protein [Lachnospiraceae bacterium]